MKNYYEDQTSISACDLKIGQRFIYDYLSGRREVFTATRVIAGKSQTTITYTAKSLGSTEFTFYCASLSTLVLVD